MKQLHEIYVGESKLSLLLGGAKIIGYKFPTDGKGRKMQASLQMIIDSNQVKDMYDRPLNDGVASVRSFDNRFDKRHPIELAVDNIRDKGIRYSTLQSLLNDASCIRVGKMVGRFGVFNDILSDQAIEKIETMLKEVKDFNDARKENLKNWLK